MSRLEIHDVAVRYGARLAVAPTSLTLEAGELVGLVGPNGAGKSSLLKALAGLVPASGQVQWAGTPLPRHAGRARARTLAYLPQSPAVHWPITVRELVALGRLPHRAFREPPGRADWEAIEWAMSQTEVSALAERRVSELSGGERARALLARALAVRAPLLLVDEPIASLDPYHQLHIMEVLCDRARGERLVVAVLHDLPLAARFCSRLILMSEGQVVANDVPERVLDAESLRVHYRVEAHLGRHDGEPVIVPWQRL